MSSSRVIKGFRSSRLRLQALLLASSALPLAIACGSSSNGDNGNGDAGNEADSSVGSSEAGSTEGGSLTDSSVGDGGSHLDGSVADSGTPHVDAGNTGDSGSPHADAGNPADSGTPHVDAGDAGGPTTQTLTTTIGSGVIANPVTINQGTSIGKAAGATPSTLSDLALDPSNSETVVSASNPFARKGNVPDKAAVFCNYSDAGAPKRITHASGASFGTDPGDAGFGTDPMVPMTPFYFPFTYTTTLTPTGNAFGGQPPIIGLFDYRPKDMDEAVVVAESDDNGLHWYFMQTLLELNPDYSDPASGGYQPGSTNTGCPATVTGDNANTMSVGGTTGDDGWGHASIVQLPGTMNASSGQFLYLLDRNPSNVDQAQLKVVNLAAASNKFPVWNTHQTNNDIKSISSALTSAADAGTPLVVKSTTGLQQPDGIMAVFPDTKGVLKAGDPITVMYVQKILNGDQTGATMLPASQQCGKAPFSGKTNHDISNVRLATTTNGVDFTDLDVVVTGLNDPTTVDFNGTRWISPRGTLIDVHGDGSLWGLYFAGGNCLDGDSDAFHYIGYAESTDKIHWTVFNDINHPIASINTITITPDAGAPFTIPATPPVVATEYWFAERLYAPSATRIDATHLSLTFAGYGVQSPNADLLDYRQIGNVVLTVSKSLPANVPNNSNAH